MSGPREALATGRTAEKTGRFCWSELRTDALANAGAGAICLQAWGSMMMMMRLWERVRGLLLRSQCF